MDPARSRLVVLLLAGLLAQPDVFASARIMNNIYEGINPAMADKTEVACEVGPEANLSCGPGLVIQVRETFYGAWADDLSRHCSYKGFNSTCLRSNITAVDLACNGKNACPIPTDREILPKPPSAMVVFTGSDLCVGFAKYLVITYDCRGQQPPPMLAPTPAIAPKAQPPSSSPLIATTPLATPEPPSSVQNTGANPNEAPSGEHEGSSLAHELGIIMQLQYQHTTSMHGMCRHAQTEACSTLTLQGTVLCPDRLKCRG